MQRIESLLRKEIGLDAASIGSSLIERTIRQRMKQHALQDVAHYRALLDASRDELRELIEAVVVTETWFFRDREPFNAFIRLVLTEWLPSHPNGPFRVLSVPCSSGEEPYSLAMALLDAGVPDTRFAIEAVDISANALVRAERAVYGKNSFRGRDLTFRDRHFQHTKEGYVLNPGVRRTVRFQHDNILDRGFLVGNAPYDFIFCRNLLIYFDRATQALTLTKLHRLLADEGVLFVGPAEMPLVSEGGFVSTNFPLSFACRKTKGAPAQPTKPEQRKPKSPPVLETSPIALNTNGSQLDVDSTPHHPNDAHVTGRETSPLAVARQLADTGQLEEALALCQAHLTREGPSAEAYYLIGLMKDASDDPEAILFYRKALYLEPSHYEALVHIVLFLERNGDHQSARPFKRRVERTKPRS